MVAVIADRRYRQSSDCGSMRTVASTPTAYFAVLMSDGFDLVGGFFPQRLGRPSRAEPDEESQEVVIW